MKINRIVNLGLMVSLALMMAACEGNSESGNKAPSPQNTDCTSPDGCDDSANITPDKGQKGAPCSSNGECKPEEFCLFSEDDIWNSSNETTCGRDRLPGQCAPRPTECSSNGFAYEVTGCDNTLYDTECYAHQSGISVLRAFAM